MHRMPWFGAACAVAARLTALAEAPRARAWDQTAARVRAGEQRLFQARAATSTVQRLDALDDAIRSFHAARRGAAGRQTDDLADLRVSAERGLVQAHEAQAEIYLQRGWLSNARDSVAAALEIDPEASGTLDLVVRIDVAASIDRFTKYQGSAAVDRIRERRAEPGSPLRPRGVTGRR